MISKIAIGITTLLSVLGSAPVVASSSTSPYDPQSTNVYYDLAVLYGDSNKDGSVTDDEYLNFQINSLAPSGKVGENTSYKYLGTMPYYVNELYLYLFSATRIDDCILNDRGQVDFDSSSYSYLLDYQNSSIQNPVTGEWIDDSVKSSSLKLVNYYHSNKGYYYKFSIPDYLAVRSEDNIYRFKPRNLRVLDVGGKLKQSFDFGASNENELLYDSNCHSSSAPYVFFSEKTYEIKAVMDLWLAPNASKVDYDKGFYFLPINKTENIVSAYEIFYVFFSFDGDFHPDEVKSVTYSASVDEYQVTQVEKVISATGVYPSVTQDIYRGTIDSYQEETVDKYSSSLSLISSNQITGTTSAEIKKIDQTFDCDTWWNHDQMTTSYSWKSIVSLDEVEKIQSNQDENWEPWKNFILSDDHRNYDFAYGIYSDQLQRQVSFPKKLDTLVAGPSTIYEWYERKTTAHDLHDVVTLGMNVVSQNKDFSIRTIHNPLTTRKVYLMGAQAPSLSDFLVNDISNFFQQYWWAVLIVALVALAILGMIFNPVFSILKFIFNAVLFVIKLVIEVLYFLLVWWWLALIKKAKGEDVPKLWLF